MCFISDKCPPFIRRRSFTTEDIDMLKAKSTVNDQNSDINNGADRR